MATLEMHIRGHAKEHRRSDRKELKRWVALAIDRYEVINYLDNDPSRLNFHRLHVPLKTTLDILMQPENSDAVLHALTEYHIDDTGSIVRKTSKREAMRLRDSILKSLKMIYEAVPPPPEPRKGKPRKTRDLYAMTRILGKYWRQTTGRPLTNAWHREDGEPVPISAGAQFVAAVVRHVAPDRLSSLPKVIEKFVKDERKASFR